MTVSTPFKAASSCDGELESSMALISTPRSRSLITSGLDNEAGRTPTMTFYVKGRLAKRLKFMQAGGVRTYFPDPRSPSTTEAPVVPVPPRTNTVWFDGEVAIMLET